MSQSDKAYTLALQGEEFFKQNRFIEAIEQWKKAAAIYDKLSFTINVQEMYVNIAIALRHQAEFLFQQNEYEYAVKYYQDASSIFELFKYFKDYAECQFELGRIHHKLGDPSQALEHFTLAKSKYMELEESSLAALSEYCIGLCLHALGSNDEALRHQQRARSLIDSDEESLLVAQIELHIGQILCSYGQDWHPEAIEHIQTSKNLNKKHNMPSGVASCEKVLGDIFLIDGDYTKSLEHFTIARSLWEEMDSQNEDTNPSIQTEIATIETHIGNVLTAMERYHKALSLYTKAEDIFLKHGLMPKFAWVQQKKGNCILMIGDYLKAFKNAEEAMVTYKKFGLLREQGFAYRDMGTALCKMEKFKRALPYLEKSLELLDLLRGQTRSINFKKSMKKDYLGIYDHLCLSHLVLHGKTGSKEHLLKALNWVEHSKCSAIAESLQFEDSLTLCPEMEQLISLEAKLLEDAMKNFSEYETLSKVHLEGKISKDQYRNSQKNIEREYDDIYQKMTLLRQDILIKCSDYGNVSIPRTYNVIDRTLKFFPKYEKWNILEFAVLSGTDNVIVFLVDSNGSISFEIIYISEENSALLAQCRDIVQTMRDYDVQGANTKLKFLSVKLYEALVPPSIAEQLKEREISHLIIIPHSFLHWVPFEVLFDGEQYWGIKYAISANFSLDLTRLCTEKRQRRKQEDSPRKPSFLIITNPLLDLEGPDNEVEKILNLVKFSGFFSQNLKEEQATKKLFIDAIAKGPVDVIHYSGHAQFMGKDPSLSSLFLHTEKECQACNGEAKEHTPQLLTAKEITTQVKFKGAPIIYLSGCETGINEVEPGDEMFGLFRSLMFAGATSFVLSRWLVDDEISVVFAEIFYQSLLAGDSVACALQKARKVVFSKDPSMFTHWASFTSQGDPFRKLSSGSSPPSTRGDGEVR